MRENSFEMPAIDPLASWFEDPPGLPVTFDLRRRLYARADACCEHSDENGVRCSRRYSLRVSLVSERAEGGIGNYQLLCRSHDLWKEARAAPRAQMWS